MRIGCDLDNTIIDYNTLFYEAALKEKLISKKHSKDKSQIKNTTLFYNKTKWKQIQEIVYCDNIYKAKVMRNFNKFYVEIKKRNIKFFIVSHKTKKINKTDLRRIAMNWMKKKKYLKNFNSFNENLFFESSNFNKIQKINSLNLDYFIDDLRSVLVDKRLKKNIKRIQFSKKIENNTEIPKLNWDGIFNYLFLKN